MKKNRKNMNNVDDVFKKDVRKKFGTVFTPPFVVDKTIDLAFKYLPEGSDPLKLTWCDPAAGDGNFLVNLYHRLMKCKSEMNTIEKSKHILTNCIHGIEILYILCEACKDRLLNEHEKICGNMLKIEREQLRNNLKIIHGNTIMVKEDEGKWELEEQEGGYIEGLND